MHEHQRSMRSQRMSNHWSIVTLSHSNIKTVLKRDILKNKTKMSTQDKQRQSKYYLKPDLVKTAMNSFENAVPGSICNKANCWVLLALLVAWDSSFVDRRWKMWRLLYTICVNSPVWRYIVNCPWQAWQPWAKSGVLPSWADHYHQADPNDTTDQDDFWWKIR